MLTRCDSRSRRFARIALVDTHEIVLAAQQLPLSHRGPADRFLAATAQVMDLALVTSGYAAGDRAPCKALLIARDLNAHWRRYVLPFASPLHALQLVDGVSKLGAG